MELNREQQGAIDQIEAWLEDRSQAPYFILSGSAGTGKTYTLKALISQLRGKVVFTAPTNKATKVLRSMLTSDDYRPICRTIHSLLGLRMEPSGEVKKLVSPDDPVDLASIFLIVIDEASMVNQELMVEIERAVENYSCRILFLGDRNQLPPVNQAHSPVWDLDCPRAALEQVMRFDNQILGLADRIKRIVDHPAPSISISADNNGIEGIWKMDTRQFHSAIREAAMSGAFSSATIPTKAIAWRNSTVGEINAIVRGIIFDNAGENEWLIGDRIILTAPTTDIEGRPMGHTDDEGTVDRVEFGQHPIYNNLKCYNLSVITDENKRISLWLIHPDSAFDFRFQQNVLISDAKLSPRKWPNYWAFMDAFHKAQHGYAITAHRAQGSTYENCFVVWNDILMNRNRQEAFRCFYVAATRAKKKLILGYW